MSPSNTALYNSYLSFVLFVYCIINLSVNDRTWRIVWCDTQWTVRPWNLQDYCNILSWDARTFGDPDSRMNASLSMRVMEFNFHVIREDVVKTAVVVQWTNLRMIFGLQELTPLELPTVAWSRDACTTIRDPMEWTQI